MRSEEGYSLLETLMSITVSAIVLASVLSVGLGQQRFYRFAAETSTAMGTLTRAEAGLLPDLLPISPAAGDLVYAGTDSLQIRAFRGVFAVCAVDSSGGTVKLTVRRLTGGGVPSVGDSALVYSQGADAGVADDTWEATDLSSVQWGTCPDGTSGWKLTVQGPAADAVSSIPVGAPLRLFRDGSYWFALRPDGWYLLTDTRGGSGTVVAGPMAPDTEAVPGLEFRYLDADGTPASAGATVRLEIDVAGVAAAATRPGGQPIRVYRTLSIGLRNST